MSYQMHSFADPDTLVNELGNTIAETLRHTLKQKCNASLVVSGGRTPVALFHYLRLQTLDWERVTITLADERCVPIESSESNARMVLNELVKYEAATARFVHIYHHHLSPEQNVIKVNQTLCEFNDPYDIVLLGMGDDGHTASIFPEASNLNELLDENSLFDCLHTDPTSVTQGRISQTRKSLLSTKYLYLHFTGQEKLNVFLKAVASSECGYPISHFIHQHKVPLDVYYSS